MCAPIATRKNSVQRFKHTTQKFPDMLPSIPRICQCMRRFFVKRPTFLAATPNLREEQNLVHLGRFLHFSQKVVQAGHKRGKPRESEKLSKSQGKLREI